MRHPIRTRTRRLSMGLLVGSACLAASVVAAQRVVDLEVSGKGFRRLDIQVVSPTFPNQTAVPRDLEIICLKCLQKDPKRRYETAKELANDLDRWSAGKPILARPVPLPEKLWLWTRRNPAAVRRSPEPQSLPVWRPLRHRREPRARRDRRSPPARRDRRSPPARQGRRSPPRAPCAERWCVRDLPPGARAPRLGGRARH